MQPKTPERPGPGFKLLLLGLLLLVAFSASTRARTLDMPLAALLEQVGKQVELFRRQYPAVTCLEEVSQAKFGKGKQIIRRQNAQFDYLILMALDDDSLRVEESRIMKKQSGKGNKDPLLVTAGFSTLILVFDPLYQDTFEFARMPDEIVDGKQMITIHFQHLPGTRSTAVLRLDSREIPLDLSGDAWIDPDSLAVVKITAELAEPPAGLGLQTLSAEVRYAPIRFASTEGVYWLPSVATIEVATDRQHWRNLHRFTDYRCFTVSSGSTIRR